jgi:uncharacterized protein (UPF0548 family)
MTGDGAVGVGGRPGRTLSYDQPGITLLVLDEGAAEPAGFGMLRHDAVLGSGGAAFEAAVDAMFAWTMHRGAGARVSGAVRADVAGAEVDIRLGPVRGGCRVVAVIDEPRRKGFAYGTLEGHPEAGEELFVVGIGGDGTVTGTVLAVSKPAWRIAALASPVARRIQHLMAERYLRALRTAAQSAPTSH